MQNLELVGQTVGLGHCTYKGMLIVLREDRPSTLLNEDPCWHVYESGNLIASAKLSTSNQILA